MDPTVESIPEQSWLSIFAELKNESFSEVTKSFVLSFAANLFIASQVNLVVRSPSLCLCGAFAVFVCKPFAFLRLFVYAKYLIRKYVLNSISPALLLPVCCGFLLACSSLG